MDSSGGIGRNNTIPWKCSEDMKRFREKTAGKVCIMGRNTFDSIVEYGSVDDKEAPLPGRVCIVLTGTRDSDIVHNIIDRGCLIASSVGDALEKTCQLIADGKVTDTSEIMVIGGEKVYKAFMPYYSRMYGTVIREEFDCDAVMPSFAQMLERSVQTEYVDKGEYSFFTCEAEKL